MVLISTPHASPHCFTLLAIDYTILGTFFFWRRHIFGKQHPFPVTIMTQRLLFDNGRFRSTAMAADEIGAAALHGQETVVLGCLDRQTYVYWTEDERWIGRRGVYKRFSSIDTWSSLPLPRGYKHEYMHACSCEYALSSSGIALAGVCRILSWLRLLHGFSGCKELVRSEYSVVFISQTTDNGTSCDL